MLARLKYRAQRLHEVSTIRLADARFTIADSGGSVALTFDDGPDPEFTTSILDVLRQHEVAATFFIVGERAELYPTIVRRIVAEGHALGWHSYSHANLSRASLLRILFELRHHRRRLEAQCGAKFESFRPPQGVLSLRAAITARAMGLQTYMWNQGGEDWQPDVTAELVQAQFRQVRPGDILLLHDGLADAKPHSSDRSAVVTAVDELIPKLKADGICFTSLSHLP